MNYYFGYGAYKSRRRIKEITGKYTIGGYGAIVKNYCLCWQKLINIPNPPRQILGEIWGENFRCYSLRKHPGIVSGVVWEICDEELEKIKRWEYAGIWKEIIEVEVTTFDGKIIKALTELVFENQQIDGIVDGINYDCNLNTTSWKIPANDKETEEEIIKIREMLKRIRGIR